MAAGGRRRSRRMRGGGKMAGAGGADLVKPRGMLGHLVKPSAVESAVKPTNANSAEEAWIYVRGCRIPRAGLRFNSQGDVYVPDSEAEEDAPEMAADRAAGLDLAPDGATGVDLAPAVAADGTAGVKMKPEVAARLAKKVLGEDLHPEVAALLAEVLSKMEPLYHECFIDLYKISLALGKLLLCGIRLVGT